jgi:N-carbamoylputrescine amidase
VSDPTGQILARAPAGRDFILYSDLDYSLLQRCPARRHFLADRRPELYPL